MDSQDPTYRDGMVNIIDVSVQDFPFDRRLKFKHWTDGDANSNNWMGTDISYAPDSNQVEFVSPRIIYLRQWYRVKIYQYFSTHRFYLEHILKYFSIIIMIYGFTANL